MQIDFGINIKDLGDSLDNFWELSTQKVKILQDNFDSSKGAPVFTVEGKYTTRGWTEWTQGFQYGIPLLIFDATGKDEMLKIGKVNTIDKMAHHITHFGVHDHGFNNLSTYGNLLRMSRKGKIDTTDEEDDFYALAIKASGAVQASRWTDLKNGGYIYSFNGPHSLFIDTIRTCRILLMAHKLKHKMLIESDVAVDLLQRAVTHAVTSAKYAVYYGEGRDQYDVSGRVAHESIFNINDLKYRCSNSQQGFSGFTTWTRGLSWAMLGFTEILEFLTIEQPKLENKEEVESILLKAAISTCDFYIENTSLDGVPYWDTGAPNLHKLGEYQKRKAQITNDFEPIDSSAAAIAGQGLLRLGKILEKSDSQSSKKYIQAGLTVLNTLLGDDYLAKDKDHQGILKHSIYHYPNNWDYIPSGAKVPFNESSMWGDYHMVEFCLTAQRLAKEHYTFFDGL